MALYVYNTATGELYSWAPNDSDPVASADELAAKGMSVASGLPALDATHAWDAATKTVVTVAAPVLPKFVSAWQFIQSFTATEAAAIKASADANVQRFMLMLTVTQQVDLNNAVVQGGIQYLAAVGLIAPERVAQILAGQVQ